MVTHEDDIAACAKRIIKMRDGLIIDDSPSPRMQKLRTARSIRQPRPPMRAASRSLGTWFRRDETELGARAKN